MGRIRQNKQYIVPGALISASYVSDLYDLVTGNTPEDVAITGSLNVTGSIYGRLIGTASWAESSSVTISSSFARSASFATSASYAPNTGVTRIIAGDNITISPTTGVGEVTISAASTGSGGGGTLDTSSFITAAQTASMTVATASYINPTFISASAAAAGFGSGGGGSTTGSSTPAFPYTGSAGISGSLLVNGTVFVDLLSLPTADPHAAGQLWRSGNFIMVSLG
jgi:hypothetical protein